MKKTESEARRRKPEYSVSVIEGIFKGMETRALRGRDLERKLEVKGLTAEAIEDLVDEAERKGILQVILPPSTGGDIQYALLPPEKREEEKKRTQHYLAVIDEAYKEQRKGHLLEDELREKLIAKGLTHDEVERAIYDAERDNALIHSVRHVGKPGYSWIPPEDRADETRFRKRLRKYMDEWREKKMMQGQL